MLYAHIYIIPSGWSGHLYPCAVCAHVASIHAPVRVAADALCRFVARTRTQASQETTKVNVVSRQHVLQMRVCVTKQL